jgi:hypothetical protein
MAETVKNTVLWVVMQSNSARAQCFVGIYHSHLQGKEVGKSRNKLKQGKVNALFIRKVGVFPNCTAKQPERAYLQNVNWL